MKIAVAMLVALGIFFGGYGAGVEKGFIQGVSQGKEEAYQKPKEHFDDRLKKGHGKQK